MKLLKTYPNERFGGDRPGEVTMELWEIEGEEKLRVEFIYADGERKVEWRERRTRPTPPAPNTVEAAESTARRAAIRAALGLPVAAAN